MEGGSLNKVVKFQKRLLWTGDKAFVRLNFAIIKGSLKYLSYLGEFSRDAFV